MQTTENGSPLLARRGMADPPACKPPEFAELDRDAWSEGPMWAPAIVMAGPQTKGSSQVRCVEWDESPVPDFGVQIARKGPVPIMKEG